METIMRFHKGYIITPPSKRTVSAICEDVACTANYLIQGGTKLVVGRAIIGPDLDDGTWRVAFPIGVHDLAFDKDDLTVVSQLAERFKGCAVVTEPFEPSFNDLDSTRAALEIARCSSKSRVSACDLLPMRASDPTSTYGSLIGREEVCAQLDRIAGAVARFGRDSVESLHLVFTGRPGTGKSTMARYLLDRFDKAGATNGTFVHADLTKISSPYVAETSVFVKQVFDQAAGGILFIDEAYRIEDLGTSQNHSLEVVDAITQLMEERRDSVIVVMAGYKDKMEHLLGLNPGLRERIGFTIDFEDYDRETLCSILYDMARARDFSVEPDALSVFDGLLDMMMVDEHFANARTVRRVLDHAVIAAAARGATGRVITEGDMIEALVRL